MKKTRNTDGPFSCFELNDGRWRAVAQLKDEADRPLKPKTIERKTKLLATKAMEAFLASYSRLRPSPSMTVAACLDAFIIRCEKKGRAGSTLRVYRLWKDTHIVPAIGHLQVKALNPNHVEAMIEDLPDVTAIRVRGLLRAAINKVARKVDINLVNVAKLAEPPSYQPETARQLLFEDFAKIIESESDPIKRALWLLYADTGLRPIEGRMLTWPELEKREDGVWIRLQKSKTPAGKRPFPITKSLAATLEAIPKTSIFLFPSPVTGEPYNETTICGWWKDAQIEAGVPVTKLYALRHFFASQKAMKVKDHVLKRFMRHTDIRTTKQYYTDAEDADLRLAVEA